MIEEPLAIESRNFSLSQLRKHFDRGVFAVPELQREFVWDKGKICKLLDSIYRGFPIGGVLVWNTGRDSQHLLRSRLHILPPFNAANREIWFLIDGQQRLSVLHHVLCGVRTTVENESGQEIDFGCFWYDAGDAEAEKPFIYAKRRPNDEHVSVVDLFAANWRARLKELRARSFARAEKCHDRVVGYRVWLTFMESRRLEGVRETFIRINSLGTPLGAADRAFARASTLNLRHLVRELQSELGHGFEGLSEEALLQTAALAMQENDVGSRAIDAMVRRVEDDPEEARSFRRMWSRLKVAVGLAADYMVGNFGVVDYGLLPSDYMVAVLSLFFYHNNNKRPARAVKETLRRWFWATAVATRYTGRGFGPNILADARLMQRLAEKGRGRFALAQLTPLHVLRHADYSRRSMLTSGYFCLLGLQGPRYIEDGEEMPEGTFSTRANRSDKHHIFPKQRLASKGFSAREYNCIPNICFLVARENQSIGAKVPRKYFEELTQGRAQLHRALRSHLIPYDRECGLWEQNVKRGFKRFVARRTEMIARAFEEEAGMKLFERE